MTETEKTTYKRVMLKISGEALMGQQGYGIDTAVTERLARDVAATVDVPFADVSAMDGYAIRGAVEPGAALAVRGTAAAGRPPEIALGPGEAAKIMTGAVVPRGGDRVIPVEQTDGGAERVVLHHAPRAGASVVRRGTPPGRNCALPRGQSEIPASGRTFRGRRSDLRGVLPPGAGCDRTVAGSLRPR